MPNGQHSRSSLHVAAHVVAMLMVVLGGFRAYQQSANQPQVLCDHWQDLTRHLLVMKSRDKPELYQSDYIANDVSRFTNISPFYIEVIRSLGSSEDNYSRSFQLILPLVYLLFFSGTYYFFLRIGVPPICAALLTIAAAATYPAGRGDDWALMPMFDRVPRNYFLAFFPWLMILQQKVVRTRWEGVLFFSIGVLANVHPVSGFCLTAVMLLAGLLERAIGSDRIPFLRSVGTGAVHGMCAIVGTLPFAVSFFGTYESKPGTSEAYWATKLEELLERDETFQLFLQGQLSIPALLPLVVAIVLVLCAVQQLDRPHRWYLGFSASVLLVYGLSYFAPRLLFQMGRDPMFPSELARCFKFSYWAILFFIGSFAAFLAKPDSAGFQSGRKSSFLFTVATVVALHLSLPLGFIPTFRYSNDEVQYLTDFRTVCDWIRKETDMDDIILCDDLAFRSWAERSNGYSYWDGVYAEYGEDLFQSFTTRSRQIRAAGLNPANQSLLDLRNLQQIEPLAKSWGCRYVVLRGDARLMDSVPSIVFRQNALCVLKLP